MDKKTCPRCRKSKPVSEFHRVRRGSDRLRGPCKACVSLEGKARVFTPEQKARAKAKQDETRAWMDSLKAEPCTDCGGTFPPVCMDWDHLPGVLKVRSVGLLLTYSRERILAEVAKCELVCANCHRIRTHQRRS